LNHHPTRKLSPYPKDAAVAGAARGSGEGGGGVAGSRGVGKREGAEIGASHEHERSFPASTPLGQSPPRPKKDADLLAEIVRLLGLRVLQGMIRVWGLRCGGVGRGFSVYLARAPRAARCVSDVSAAYLTYLRRT